MRRGTWRTKLLLAAAVYCGLWTATALLGPAAALGALAPAGARGQVESSWCPAPFVVHIGYTWAHALAEGDGGGWCLWLPGFAVRLTEAPGAIACKIFK